MNGSAYHIEVPWPVINVHQNQTVVIHIFNCASSEQHGLAITRYFNGGVILQPDTILHLDLCCRSEGNVYNVLQHLLRHTSLHAEWGNYRELTQSLEGDHNLLAQSGLTLFQTSRELWFHVQGLDLPMRVFPIPCHIAHRANHKHSYSECNSKEANDYDNCWVCRDSICW